VKEEGEKLETVLGRPFGQIADQRRPRKHRFGERESTLADGGGEQRQVHVDLQAAGGRQADCGGVYGVGDEFGEEGEEGGAVGELFDGADCGDALRDVRVEPREHCGQWRVLPGNLLHISKIN
jgi:hypothetical protein